MGTTREFVDKSGVKHTIRVSRFVDHDHQNKPIYHPLEDSENPNQLVVTIASAVGALPPSYPPVYASCVTGCWDAYRGSIAFNFRHIAAKYKLPQSLIDFCELAAAIESKTDTYPTYTQEPTDEEKKILLPLLKQFLQILPTPQQFRSWFEERNSA